ncbi:hypothetical protein Gogos_012769, partial [Gossypium gossypioides]|nr:hypothetical protein [Gossypium gossypioides]
MTSDAAEIMYKAIASSDSSVNVNNINNRIITEVLGLESTIEQITQLKAEATSREAEVQRKYEELQLQLKVEAAAREAKQKAWKKLKDGDTGLGWNPIKIIVDASNDWWESRLKVVPETKKFITSSIDLEFKGKLDHVFN